MLALIIKPYNAEVIIKQVEGWEEIVKSINCDFFDVVRMWFKDDKDRVPYDIYVDDIGYFKETTCVSVLSENYPPIVGTILIGRSDKEGNEMSLTVEDIAKILRHVNYYSGSKDSAGIRYCYLGGVIR
jgi:hypothetical protein